MGRGRDEGCSSACGVHHAGRAKAAAIDARGGADALQISAGADATAEVTRAEGSKAAAQLLNEQPVAVPWRVKCGQHGGLRVRALA